MWLRLLPTARLLLWFSAAALALAVEAPAAADDPTDQIRTRIRTAVETGERDATALLSAEGTWTSIPRLRIRVEAARQQLRESKQWLSGESSPASAVLEAQAAEAEMAARELQRILTLAGSGERSGDPAVEAVRQGLVSDLRAMIGDGADYVTRWRAAVATSRRRSRRPVAAHQTAAPYFAVLDGAIARSRQCLDATLEEIRLCRSELARAYDRAAVAGDWNRSPALLERQLAQQPSDEPLRTAAVAFLQGRYDEVVNLLESSLSVPKRPYRDRRNAAQRHLLVSAARYALFQLGGGSDLAHRERAVASARAALSADPDLTPPESVFSPRFILFFESNR